MDAITVAKFLSIPTAFLLSGYSMGFSQNSVPLVYNQPAAISAPILEGVYYQGAKVVAPGALMTAAAFGYLAYTAPTTRERNLYAACGAMVVATQPWTAFVMLPGIHRMMDIAKSAAEQAKADQSGEAVKLLKGWVYQNYLRAVLYLAAGFTGLYTSADLR